MGAAAWTAVFIFVLPLALAVVAFALPRVARVAALAAATWGLGAALALVYQVARRGAFEVSLGGWAPPLGIAWRIDGAAALMVLLTTAAYAAATLYRSVETAAAGDAGFEASGRAQEGRLFASLWLALLSALCALMFSADAFNLYVALELVALGAVALIALPGGAALEASWRYLLATLAGSSLFLLGVALLYGQYGVLDLALFGERIATGPAEAAAAALMTAGLLLKTAVFPLHFWLPAAHGRAPAAVSAVLSGVVVGAAFYVMARLWLGPFFGLLTAEAGALLGGMGAAAVLWGGVLALAQRRLKMLLAYSTVSQLGFAMLVFPIASAGAAELAWRGALAFVVAHGAAKASLFLAAGAIAAHAGHDRVIRGRLEAPGLAYLAFALSAASLIGIPPTGGFVGKWWLLSAAVAAEAWLWAAVVLAGTLVTAAYLVRALDRLAPPAKGGASAQTVYWLSLPALILALAAVGAAVGVPLLAPVLGSPAGGA